MTDTVRVRLWGRDIGAVTWIAQRGLAVFQYMPEFAASRIELAPLMMPLRESPYEFSALSRDTFKGLPGLLSDSLPDKFGSALINAWLAREGRSPTSFSPVERLCYTGTRGMGALEFQPSLNQAQEGSRSVDLEAMVSLANRVLDERVSLSGKFEGFDDQRAIEEILRVGTSAGGARAKAVLAWNPKSGEFRSGQLPVGEGFGHWLIKFDGVSANGDKELADPVGFGRVEYAYYLMARRAKVDMSECWLHEEGGRAHFMTKRFDRTEQGGKLHMQSLGALKHLDFNRAGESAYEEAIQSIKSLGLGGREVEQQVRRALFNILARNQDDHVKNIAFLMDRSGQWTLSPAFDVTYSYNPEGAWTNRHQMTLNGKTNAFENSDLLSFCKKSGLKKGKALRVIEEVSSAIRQWQEFAALAGVSERQAASIEKSFRHEVMM